MAAVAATTPLEQVPLGRVYTILATGNRSLTAREHGKTIEQAFETMVSYLKVTSRDQVTVVVGSATGADLLVTQLVRLFYPHWTLKIFTANWGRHGRAAGFLMNQQMVDEEKPNVLLAFPKAASPGTRHAIQYFEKKTPNSLYKKITECS